MGGARSKGKVGGLQWGRKKLLQPFQKKMEKLGVDLERAGLKKRGGEKLAEATNRTENEKGERVTSEKHISWSTGKTSCTPGQAPNWSHPLAHVRKKRGGGPEVRQNRPSKETGAEPSNHPPLLQMAKKFLIRLGGAATNQNKKKRGGHEKELVRDQAKKGGGVKRVGGCPLHGEPMRVGLIPLRRKRKEAKGSQAQKDTYRGAGRKGAPKTQKKRSGGDERRRIKKSLENTAGASHQIRSETGKDRGTATRGDRDNLRLIKKGEVPQKAHTWAETKWWGTAC